MIFGNATPEGSYNRAVGHGRFECGIAEDPPLDRRKRR
jgi:hypothetical protein